MTDLFIDTLRSWQNYYFMSGGAAAGLLGLMFVALSLGMHLMSDITQAAFEIFVTPSLIYFVSGLLISCVMLVPSYDPPVLALLLGGGGFVGLTRAALYALQLRKAAAQNQDFDFWEWLFHIILPPISYAVLLAAALCFALNQWEYGFVGVWIADVLLLLCAISNTWSLVLWIISQRRE